MLCAAQVSGCLIRQMQSQLAHPVRPVKKSADRCTLLHLGRLVREVEVVLKQNTCRTHWWFLTCSVSCAVLARESQCQRWTFSGPNRTQVDKPGATRGTSRRKNQDLSVWLNAFSRSMVRRHQFSSWWHRRHRWMEWNMASQPFTAPISNCDGGGIVSRTLVTVASRSSVSEFLPL